MVLSVCWANASKVNDHSTLQKVPVKVKGVQHQLNFMNRCDANVVIYLSCKVYKEIFILLNRLVFSALWQS